MPILDDDLILVGRGGGSFRAVATEIRDFVAGGDAVVFRGTVNLNNAPGGQLDPAVPLVGDMYINDTEAASVDAGWAGIGGQAAVVNARILFDGSEWNLIGGDAFDPGVTSVAVTEPITSGGTAAVPNIGIQTATNARRGSVQLADNPPNGAGNLVTTNADDVLIAAHFDELAGRIQTAAGGGVQTITGGNAITVTGADNVTVAAVNGTTAAVGVVQLQDNINATATTAATPNAVQSFAVPLDLRTLTELV